MSAAARASVLVPLIVGCAQFMHQFDGSAITVAVPAMAASLNEDPLRLNLAITCYLLALAVFVPISGWMADRYGAKRVFLAAIALFTVSSAMCGLSNSLIEIMWWRTLQGIGGAMMTPVGRFIVVKSVPRHEIVRAMNYVTIPAVLGPVIGPSVSGFIVTYFSWPWIFFTTIPIGLVGLALVYAYIPNLKEEEVPPLDLRGFILLGVALATLVFGFSTIGRGPLPTSMVVASIALGAICAILYYLHYCRTLNPIIDLKLLRIRTFGASVWGGALFYLGTTSQVFLFALLFQIGFGFSAFHAGLILLSSAAGSTVMRFTFRPILAVFGFRWLLILNAGVCAAFLVACSQFTEATPLTLVAVILFIGGFARSMQFTAVQSLGYAEVSTELMSRATSLSAMAQQLMQSVGVGLAALIVYLNMTLHGRTGLTADDVATAFMTLGFLALVSTVVFFRLPAHAGSELTSR